MLPLLWSIQLVKSWCQAITYTPTNFELAESDNCQTILQPYNLDVIAKNGVRASEGEDGELKSSPHQPTREIYFLNP